MSRGDGGGQKFSLFGSVFVPRCGLCIDVDLPYQAEM